MEVKSSSKITVSFYGMNHQSVEYPKQIPDFLQVHGSTENKEAPMPDLPSFAHKHNDIDDMLARFDADVMQIEKNFDSLKGSLAALSQGLSKEKTAPSNSSPRFHTDLDQIFADFDQEVHKALVVPDMPKEEFPQHLAPKEDSWLHPADITPTPSTEPIETEEFDALELPPLPEEDLGSFDIPNQEELDTIARDEAEADISEFLMEEVTPLVEDKDNVSVRPLDETFIVGQDIIEDVEVFLPKEEVLIGSVPVVEEETPSFIDETKFEAEENYEEISIESIYPQEEQNIEPINIESEENSLNKVDSISFLDIIGQTTRELDELDTPSSDKVEDISIKNSNEVDFVSTEHNDMPINDIHPIDIEPENDDFIKESFDKLMEEPAMDEEEALSTDELLAIPTMPTEPAMDEEEALSTDELLAIPTMPVEPAQPAEISIDLNAEAEILARFATLNSSSSSSETPPVAFEARIATSSTGITSLSRDELITVMSEIDILLEYLPNHKIEELAHKDFYFLYLRLLDDLGI